MPNQTRLLIFIVAYNAEKHVEKVLARIPKEKLTSFDYEILIIDDQSKDDTFERAVQYQKNHPELTITVLYNQLNQGYGGNQKLGYRYAQLNKFEVVLLLHGDGQYAPEEFERLILPILGGSADAVFGSRMMNKRDALKGKMPYYKFVGNIILTTLQNKILKTNLSEFHTGYRAYKVSSLAALPIERNSNDFHFDTQIIIQLLIAKQKIVEVPIPTHYGDEICYVNGFKYAYNILKASVQSRLQRYGIYYLREYDLDQYRAFDTAKINYASTHSYCLKEIKKKNAKILEIGAITDSFAQHLFNLGHTVTGIGTLNDVDKKAYSKYYYINLDQVKLDHDCSNYDYIIMLDFIEHLSKPELFLDQLRENCKISTPAVIVSTPNIAFFLLRIQLLIGNFNYSKRGILDMDHKRLFTFNTFKKLCNQSGFTVIKSSGVPAPYALVFSNKVVAGFISNLHLVLIKLLRNLFSYQIISVIKSTPTVEYLSKYISRSFKDTLIHPDK